MDVDISDILADISRPAAGHSSSTSYFDTDVLTDHQLLTRSWISERCAPDLLPYPTELMTRVMSRLQRQIATIEDLASGMGDSYGGTGKSTANSNLTLSILQTDLSRTQFILRSYLRQRLDKLTKFATYYLSGLERDDKTSYLSLSEIQFLQNHQALLSGFYDATFLHAFPPALRRLDDNSGGVPMVEGPDRGKAVVVRCLADDEWGNEVEVDEGLEDGASVELRMKRGQVWVVRWRDVRRGVEKGDLELL